MHGLKPGKKPTSIVYLESHVWVPNLEDRGAQYPLIYIYIYSVISRSRYGPVFDGSSEAPCPLGSIRYEATPMIIQPCTRWWNRSWPKVGVGYVRHMSLFGRRAVMMCKGFVFFQTRTCGARLAQQSSEDGVLGSESSSIDQTRRMGLA